METFYKILLNPTKENLHSHGIHYFDKVLANFRVDGERIINYINDCFCYKSPWIVDGKNWSDFLLERVRLNGISKNIQDDILNNKLPEVVDAIWQYINHQNQPLFATKVVKENLRMQMFELLNTVNEPLAQKKTANEMITSLDAEIESINEKLIQDNQVFGKGAGFDAIKKAKSVTQLSIVNVD